MKLEDKIGLWIIANPERAYAGNRMLEQLKRVRSEYTGEKAKRLETLVAETLLIQHTIDKSRKVTQEHKIKLVDLIQVTKDDMRKAEKKIQPGIIVASHKITTKKLVDKTSKNLAFVPGVPTVVDKSLN